LDFSTVSGIQHTLYNCYTYVIVLRCFDGDPFFYG